MARCLLGWAARIDVLLDRGCGGDLMDGDICPPYWPELIWRLIHRPGPPPPPPWFEELFLTISIDQMAAAHPNRALGERIREVTTASIQQIGETMAKGTG
jgi:hypothetical protein